MQRPKVNEVAWDYFHYEHVPNEYSYRIEMARQHPFQYFRIRYIKGGQDKTKLLYGERAWSDLERLVHDLGDWAFSVDKIAEEMVQFMLEQALVASEDRNL